MIAGRLTETQKIFDGVRTKQVSIMKEQNFVSSMCEHNGILYLGCKDGNITVTDQKPLQPASKRFVPHNNKDVKTLSVVDGILVTLSVTQQLAVWDMKHYMNTTERSTPEKLLLLEKVSAFELIKKNNRVTLYYCKEGTICETTVEVGTKVEEGQVSTRQLDRLEEATYIHHVGDGRILFADKSENMYMLTS